MLLPFWTDAFPSHLTNNVVVPVELCKNFLFSINGGGGRNGKQEQAEV